MRFLVRSTRSNEILYISAQACTVLTTSVEDLQVTRETFPSLIRFNINNRLLSKRYELLSFTPFPHQIRR